MQQTIKHRDDPTGAGKHLAPFGESFIGRNQGAPFFMPAVDQLEEQISMAVRIREIADLVNSGSFLIGQGSSWISGVICTNI